MLRVVTLLAIFVVVVSACGSSENDTTTTLAARRSMHHHSLLSRLCNSATRSGKTSSFATGAPNRQAIHTNTDPRSYSSVKRTNRLFPTATV